MLGNATIYAGVGGDEVAGALVRTGGNILGTDVFSGDTDVGDTSAAAVFAATTEIAPGVLAGVLADNGGPTETIALRLAQGNPAIGGADPATATPTDQRGVARDADPDLGAFEAEQVGPPAPFRIEAETLARVSGFKLENLGAASGDMVIKSPNPKVEAHARFTFTEQDGFTISTSAISTRTTASRVSRSSSTASRSTASASIRSSEARAPSPRRGRSGTSPTWRSRPAT